MQLDRAQQENAFITCPSPYLGFEQLGYNPNFEIALNMSLDQLMFYCTSNELFKNICMDQEFWLEKLRREYPQVIQYKPINMSWVKYYLQAQFVNEILTTPGIVIPGNMDPYQLFQELDSGNIKWIDVRYNNHVIGSILMFSTDKHVNLYERAVDLLSIVDYNYDPNITVAALQYPGRYALRKNSIENALINQRNHQWSVQQGGLWDMLSIISFYQ